MAIAEQTPSGGAFFATTPDTIFVPEDFRGDEALMIDTAEQFSRKEVLPLSERLDEKEEGLMPALIRKAGELGFCGVDTPEAYGGLGLGKNLAARILEYLSMNGSFSVTIGVSSGIAQLGTILFGREDQKQKYLPKLASGEWIGAYALSEPNSGSDALSASTRADFKNGKWILNGTKMWISNAAWAEVFLVMAKIDGDKFSAFIVERGFPGVSISREEHKLGLKGSSTARLILENAEVPEENLLHEPGLGHQVALNALNLGRFKLTSMSMGPARDALRLGAQYALDRKQFGQPISSFGLIRQKFAESASRYFAAEAMTYRTGALIDSAFAMHGGDVAGNRRAAEEYALECSACKVHGTEMEAFLIDEMLQVYGGYGFTEEFPMARHYRDARVSRIYEGTNEINRIFLADRLLRRAKEARDHAVLGRLVHFRACGQSIRKAAGEPNRAWGHVRSPDPLLCRAIGAAASKEAWRRCDGPARDLPELGERAGLTCFSKGYGLGSDFARADADPDAVAEAVCEKKGPL